MNNYLNTFLYFLKKIFILIFILNFFSLKAQEKEKIKFKDVVVTSGYIKYLNQTALGNKDSLLNDNIIHHRINIKAYLGKLFEAKLEARNRVFYGESVKINPFYASSLDNDDGFIDMSWNLLKGRSIILNTKIDRAYLNFYKGKFNIKLGRQRINWGITNVWNPNDLFNAYNFLDFDYEEKPGTDALRIEYSGKGMSSTEFAYRPAKSLNKTTIALLYKFNKWKYDYQILVANYKKDIALGFGWAGAIKKVGFKGESTFFHQRKNFIKTKGTLSSSIGLEYSFKDGVNTNFGFLFNSDGINKVVSVVNSSIIFSSNLSPKALMPTKYSFFGQAQKNFGPAWSANVSVMYGAGMHLLVVVPNISYSIKENWDIDFIGQSYFIQKNIYSNLGNQISLRLRYSY